MLNSSPHARAVTSAANPFTWVGLEIIDIGGEPPQHQTLPSSSSAQGCVDWSAQTPAAGPGSPSTATGVALSLAVPSPSSPSRLLPQHRIVPEPSKNAYQNR